ncbi:hypothetical protein HNQ74_001054 [Bartonella doshiae]|nr:hypothetical protein [Bartonella doshiae]
MAVLTVLEFHNYRTPYDSLLKAHVSTLESPITKEV